MIFLSIDDASLQAMTLKQLRTEGLHRYIYNHNVMDKATLIRAIVDNDIREAERERQMKEREDAERRTRSFALRQQENPDPACLKYPFSFMDDYGRQVKPIPGQPVEDVGDFPNNIAHYFWIHEGQNDTEPWLTICRLTSGVYVFYKGECDYTGFDCQGSMELYASKDPAVIIQMAMGESDYNKYIDDTP